MTLPSNSSIHNSTISNSSLIGDEHRDNEHHPHHAYLPILFAFGSVLIGSLLKDYSPHSRFFLVRKIPYTCLVFLFWAVVEIVNVQLPIKYLGKSIDAWTEIDPHLLLFAFLPALLFGDAKAVDTHLLSGKIKGEALAPSSSLQLAALALSNNAFY